MKIVKTAISRILLTCILTVIYGCSGDTVYVEIDNPRDRDVYLRLLNEKGFEYTTDRLGTIAIKIDSIEKLNSEMKDYYEYRESEISRLNKTLKDKRTPENSKR